MLVRKIEEAVNKEIPRLSSQLEHMGNEVKKPITLNRCDSEMLGAIQNKDGETSFNLLSIPREESVKYSKLDNNITDKLGIYTKQEIDIQIGLYNRNTGLINTTFTAWKCAKVNCNYGEKYKATALVGGDITSMILFYDENDNVISTLNDGISGDDVLYENFIFSIPESCVSFAITGLKTQDIIVYKYLMEDIKNKINALEDNFIDFKKIEGLVSETGLYNANNGRFMDFSAWKNIKYNCSEGEKFRVTASIDGEANALVVFFNNDTFVSSLEQGENGSTKNYSDYEFTVPSNVTSFAVCGKSTNEIIIKNRQTVTMENINILINDLKNKTNDIPLNFWNGKKIVWFGTSIPECGYPQLVGEMLGANVVNEAVGSSMCRYGSSIKTTDDERGWNGLSWNNIGYALSHTNEDKEYFINNWSTLRNNFGNNPPETLSETEKRKIRSCSYEKKLVEKHLGENRADLYVFDHGHNDYLFYNKNGGESDITTIPSDLYDRSYFIGAMNFIIKLILEDNPHARICFVGHYENKKKPLISEAQEILASLWNFPLFKLWDKTGWTQMTVKTTGYWQDNYTWIESGGSEQELTMTQIWMKDNLHPRSEKALSLLAGLNYEFIKSIR